MMKTNCRSLMNIYFVLVPQMNINSSVNLFNKLHNQKQFSEANRNNQPQNSCNRVRVWACGICVYLTLSINICAPLFISLSHMQGARATGQCIQHCKIDINGFYNFPVRNIAM